MQTRSFWSETIDESSNTTETKYLNFALHFSRLNRRYLPQVDEKGNALNYIVAIKQRSRPAAASSNAHQVISTMNTANNGYVTKAAIKAWHRARVKMLRREGFSLKDLGPYHRSLRFALNTSSGGGDAFSTGGEYSATRIAVETAMDSANASDTLEADNIIDDYTLTLCDDTVATGSAEGGETKYTTVGIIASWLDSRRSTSDFINADVSIDHEANPLYNLLSGSMASEEVLEIVADHQQEEPPYGADTVWDDLFSQASLSTTIQSGWDQTIVSCPAGLMQMVIQSLNSDGNTDTDVIVDYSFELLDIVPM